MDKPKRYECYYLTDMGNEYSTLSREDDEDGEWYSSDEMDAYIADLARRCLNYFNFLDKIDGLPSPINKRPQALMADLEQIVKEGEDE
jgi:hypothetical protein